MASCNGLVCFALYHRFTHTSGYLIWNPSTRTHRNIPRSNTFESFYSSCESDYSFGFGYDYSTDDYNLKENTNRTIFKPKPIIEERTSDPKIKVATCVESLYSPDCNDWPDVGDQVLARKLSNVSI